MASELNHELLKVAWKYDHLLLPSPAAPKDWESLGCRANALMVRIESWRPLKHLREVDASTMKRLRELTSPIIHPVDNVFGVWTTLRSVEADLGQSEVKSPITVCIRFFKSQRRLLRTRQREWLGLMNNMPSGILSQDSLRSFKTKSADQQETALKDLVLLIELRGNFDKQTSSEASWWRWWPFGAGCVLLIYISGFFGGADTAVTMIGIVALVSLLLLAIVPASTASYEGTPDTEWALSMVHGYIAALPFLDLEDAAAAELDSIISDLLDFQRALTVCSETAPAHAEL